MRKALISTLAALCLGIATGAIAYVAYTPSAPGPGQLAGQLHPVWREVKWAFPIDQWGLGKAFRCDAKDCGTEVNVYLRAKIGFCNCATGVSDDDELDRIGDYDLIGNQLSALAPGRPIKIAWMNGRSRAFTIGGPHPLGKTAISVGFNDHCDAIIATVVVGHDRPDALQPSVIAFLNGDRVLRWAEVTLGL
jgi:hypothetical protein